MPGTCAYCAGDAAETCSMCQKPICTDHTQKALPYLRLGEFLGTIFRTLFRAPGTLRAVLTEPGEEEPFCPACTEVNSRCRVQEQRKFFYLLLGLALLAALIIYLIVRF